MLTINVPLTQGESYNEETGEFIPAETYALHLEHSLVSLSKWESEHEKPFLGKTVKSPEESVSYVKAMTLDPNVPSEIFEKLTKENVAEIDAYLEAKMTATWFNERNAEKPSRKIITAELIYYWMITLNIPLEWENRHLNRLLTLIRVCNLENAPQKKLTRAEMAERNRTNAQLNAERRAKMNTRG